MANSDATASARSSIRFSLTYSAVQISFFRSGHKGGSTRAAIAGRFPGEINLTSETNPP